MKELGIGTFYQDPEGYTKYWIDTENRMRPLMEKVSQQK
jgi:hypothetical protein